LGGTGAVGTLGTGKDAPRGEDEDVAVGELLFEFTGETGYHEALVSWDASKELRDWKGGPKRDGDGEYKRKRKNLPLLHLMEALKVWDGDKDDDCLLAVANFNLQSIKVSMRAP